MQFPYFIQPHFTHEERRLRLLPDWPTFETDAGLMITYMATSKVLKSLYVSYGGRQAGRPHVICGVDPPYLLDLKGFAPDTSVHYERCYALDQASDDCHKLCTPPTHQVCEQHLMSRCYYRSDA